MNLPERFAEFLGANRLLTDARPTLLAVSGGLDSMVLAHLFQRAGHPLGIAHCNFQLRGAESDADEGLVRLLAENWQVPFFSTRFETGAFAEKNGLSIQMAARQLRYAWFRETALQNGFARVATAHNLNDSVETALINFARGTGLGGLKGIAIRTKLEDPAGGVPEGEGSSLDLIRPLLFASRPEIESYAHQNSIPWRDDSSNAADDYTRNYLRHRILPLFEAINPAFMQTAGRNLGRLRETDDNLQFLLEQFFGKNTSPESGFSIEKQKLEQLPAPRRALQALLKNRGFTEEQTRQVAASLDQTGFEIYSGSGWRLLNDRKSILLVPPASETNPARETLSISPDDLMVSVPEGGRLLLVPTVFDGVYPDGRATVLLDAGKLIFPLILRHWQPGDVFQPFGMDGHSQKLQDFFTNLKLSRLEKEKVRVLVNGDGALIWVIGHRPDERFRVTGTTNKFLKINYS